MFLVLAAATLEAVIDQPRTGFPDAHPPNDLDQ